MPVDRRDVNPFAAGQRTVRRWAKGLVQEPRHQHSDDADNHGSDSGHEGPFRVRVRGFVAGDVASLAGDFFFSKPPNSDLTFQMSLRILLTRWITVARDTQPVIRLPNDRPGGTRQALAASRLGYH